jgi:hypothetical protein
MRVKRNRSTQPVDGERGATKRRKSPKGGVPRLGLWEVGVGAVWK